MQVKNKTFLVTAYTNLFVILDSLGLTVENKFP